MFDHTVQSKIQCQEFRPCFQRYSTPPNFSSHSSITDIASVLMLIAKIMWTGLPTTLESNLEKFFAFDAFHTFGKMFACDYSLTKDHLFEHNEYACHQYKQLWRIKMMLRSETPNHTQDIW